MKTKLSRKDIEAKIRETFSSHPHPSEIKKLKQIAMHKNSKLGAYKKKFCKKCYTFFTIQTAETRIKKDHKRITCKKCGNVSRYKL